MEIYLVRHTTPLVEKGICYGQADLDVTASFIQEAVFIKQQIPAGAYTFYSSPLQRCSKLANYLAGNTPVTYHNDLKELNCGLWELQRWDDIPRHEIDPWMNDFVNVPTPGGESYTTLFNRTTQCFNAIAAQQQPAVIVTHGGVIRSILSFITNTQLADSFKVFKLHYGCVVKVHVHTQPYTHHIIANIASATETHKPSYF